MENESLTKIKQTLTAALDAFISGNNSYDLDISDLSLRINIKGPSWSGIVDRPLAKFLLDLDKKVSDELVRLGVHIPQSEHGFIALQVQDGSMEALLKYGKGILQVYSKMKTQDKILMALAILLALGIYKAPDILKEANAPELQRINSQEKTDFVRAVTSLASSGRDLQQPLRSLVSKMGVEDKLTLPASKAPMSKEDVSDHLEKGHRVRPTHYYIDQRYIVDALSTKKPNAWEVSLRLGETTFTAKLLLSPQDANLLLTQFQEAHTKGSNIAPDLQVTARINNKGVRSAEVIGIGEPRENSMRLSEAMALEVVEAKGFDGAAEEEITEVR